MSKKIVISEIGGPEVLKYIDYDLPSNLQRDQIRIKQISIGVNFIDTYHRSGIYPLPSKLPACPGLEAAGEIIELGTEVKDFVIGDKVCYATVPLGAYCEIRDFSASKVIKIPNGMSTDTAASVLLKGMTVEYLFERLYKIKKDEFLLFHAAAGGVGLIASQWARSVGAKMIGTVSSDTKAELAEKNGCAFYKRVPALGTEENFINGLAELVLQPQTRGDFVSSIMCPNKFVKCPCLGVN